LPDDVRAADLDPQVRAELRSLPRPVAETVARHLVAAGELMEVDAQPALAHAMAARRLAPRIGPVREAVGLAAYRAGEWQSALSELRTYHRMSGSQAHLAVLADCERALGRPERALDLYRTGQRAGLPAGEAVELLIVAAGAHADLGQRDAALAMLQVPELSVDPPAAHWVARLRYAYADILLAGGQPAQARDWFARAAAVDEEAETDAVERLLELDGVTLDDAAADPELADAEQVDPESAAESEPELAAESEPAAEESPGGSPTAAGRLVDSYDLVILDLDGVVVLGEQPVPAAVDVIEALHRDGPPVLFATNNASRSPAEVVTMLTRIGVAADPEDVLTSAMVAAQVLAQRLPAQAAVLVIGTEALADEIRRVGLSPITDTPITDSPVTAAEQPAAVVQGYGPQVGWAALAEAAVAIRAGALWVVTNTDSTLPSPRGPLPGNGALVAVLRTALARGPDLVVGKPEPIFFRTAAQRHRAEAPLVVGDRLDTDIEGAARAGMDSLLVLTGVTDRPQARAATAAQRPTHVGRDLTALLGPGDTAAGDG
jgi:HAD superfamily hydrolase (TIGR01450 family)